MARLFGILLGGGLFLGREPLPSLRSADVLAETTVDVERRLTKVERNVERIDDYGSLAGLSFLFGAFCALWAQNTNRSAWLWFFLGAIFSFISVIVLLVKNNEDRYRLRRSTP